MARLTAAQRKKLPASAFAIPSKREFPINDKAHARAALGRLGTPAAKGHQTAIKKKAATKLGGATKKAAPRKAAKKR